MDKGEETELNETKKINSLIKYFDAKKTSQHQATGINIIKHGPNNDNANQCIDFINEHPTVEEEAIYDDIIGSELVKDLPIDEDHYKIARNIAIYDNNELVKDLTIDEDHYKIARNIEINKISSQVYSDDEIVDVANEDHYKMVKRIDWDNKELETLDADVEKLSDADDVNNCCLLNETKVNSDENDDQGVRDTGEFISKEEEEEEKDDIYAPVELESFCDSKEDDIYMDVVKESSGCQENESSNENRQPWYWKDADRDTVEKALNNFLNEEGKFVVRDSKRGGLNSPHAISVIHSGSVFHVLVRKREDGKMAIGKSKFGEKKFLNLTQLVEFYQNNDLMLFDAEGNVIGVVQLIDPPEKNF